MATRKINIKDPTELLQLIKRSDIENPAKAKTLWMHQSSEDVADNYHDFLVALAQTNMRVNRKVMRTALKKFFEGSTAVYKDFTDVIANTLAFCKGKRRGMTSGSKLDKAVFDVARAFGPCSASDTAADPSESSDDAVVVASTGATGHDDNEAHEQLTRAIVLVTPADSRPKALKRADSMQSMHSIASSADTPTKFKRLNKKTTAPEAFDFI